MKKILGYTLASLALAAMSVPAHAWVFGGSVRGDVGELGSQVPYFGLDSIVDSTNYSSTTNTFYSNRNQWNWDFTGRLFVYLNCSPCDPCPMYVAASWQGSEFAVDSEIGPYLETAFSHAIIPIRADGRTGFLQPYGTISVLSNTISGSGTEGLPFVVTPVTAQAITVYDNVLPSVVVRNEFSKAKLGLGFELIKRPCFGMTIEVGANYLNAKLSSEKQYDLIVSPTPPSAIFVINVAGTQILSTTQTGNVIVAPTFSPDLELAPLANSLPSATVPLPFNFIHRINEKDETEGFGLYAMIKGEYKFSQGCFGNCFSVYGKAEVSDIIGRQRYDYDYFYSDTYAVSPSHPGRVYSYQEVPYRQYNNIVEVDLEAALVYSPCFDVWDDLNMSVAFGIRTDSFVNLFSHLTYDNNQSIWNLSRPSLFLELSLKM